MKRMPRGVAVAAVALALVVGACSKDKPNGGATSSPTTTVAGAKELTGAGATFPAPLYQRWGDEYNKKNGVKINYQAIGSGGGIQQITAKTVDFGASDAPMKDEELTKAPGILHIPTVFGAVVVAFNLPGVDKLSLDGDTVAGIFMATIKKWNDSKIKALNPGVTLPSTAITVVHRSDGSGTTNIFTSYLTEVNAEWKAKIGKGKEVAWPAGELGGKGNDGVTALVKQTSGAVGYVELAYAKKNSMAFALMKNAAGKFVEASLDSVTAAAAGAQVPDDLRFSIVNAPGDASYPISGATWLLVYKDQTDAAKAKTLVDFLKWGVTDGQAFAKELLYAPLPSSLATKAMEKIASITVNGRPV